MNKPLRFQPPPVTDNDAAWACDVLGLPGTAFSGPNGRDPRLEVLKSNAALDIEACPGSGKTTLLVAKLAILARKWTDVRMGICVLSHTNVARKEIERRLGNTAEGKRLLSYPHFVGTIHGFVNEFLAIPWLRSLGHPVRVVDNDQCEQHRRRLLALAQFSALANYVNPREANGKLNVVSKWCVALPAFGVLKENAKPEFKDATGPAARQLSALAGICVKDGYYRYDEMFMWARNLVDEVPEVRNATRERFPMLFIDEVQDNSEEQSALLFRLFMEGDRPVVRQRFGDANQAIYQHARQTDGATTDRFPDKRIRRDIPNSHRFGQQIGNLANPLALEPQNLIGCGPPPGLIKSDTSSKHAIFLFGDKTVQRVIGTYASYLEEVFSQPELRDGIFTTVGGVHRPGEDDNLPRFVGQYWPQYDHELTATEPNPSTFLQYVMAGRKLAHSSGEAHYVVENVADGLLRLVRLSNPTADLGNRKRKHRHVLELLADNAEARATYVDLVTFLAIERGVPSAEEWNNKWSDAISTLAETIGGARPDPDTAKAFLHWQMPEDQNQDRGSSRQRDNLFRYPAENPRVQIRVGSIHSVKGETHTATLVLDTYFHGHHLATLKPWLLGRTAGKGKEHKRNLSRLKQHYVAMTRPTHLLCLAMREDAFTEEEILLLQDRSWRIARLRNDDLEWL